jgi:hypothetical protein
MNDVTRLLLKWTAAGRRTHAEASSRWGMYWDEALDAGLVEQLDWHTAIINGYRHRVTPVALTAAGRALLEGKDR